MKEYTMEAPTAFLRFVIREGESVLQQRWSITHYDDRHIPSGVHGEWRDVKTEDESS